MTTLLALHCGLSCGRETNPLSLALLAQGGERALLLEKELTTMAGVGLLAVDWLHLPRGCFWLAVAVNVGMAFTVANNLFWLVLREIGPVPLGARGCRGRSARCTRRVARGPSSGGQSPFTVLSVDGMPG